MSLFEFNDDFIASIAGGMSDEDVLEMFAESARAGADVLERRLIRTVGREVAMQATFRDGAFEIPLDQEQYDAEFGDGTETPKATIRRAIISSQITASHEMSKVLDAS